MSKKRIQVKLYEVAAGAEGAKIIQSSGGRIVVTKPASPRKATIYSRSGTTFAAQANSFALTYGAAEFYYDDAVDASVDVYILAPGGQFVSKTTLVEGLTELVVGSGRHQEMILPFHLSDTAAATETDTGFDLPENSQVLGRLSGLGVRVTALEAGKTIDFGLGEAVPVESGGDANGFIAASSLAALGLVIATNGALFSTNAPHVSTAVAARSLTYTLSAGTTVAAGYIHVPYLLVASAP